MERIGQNFLLFLGAVPAVGLCYSFGVFWALDPSLFRFFSFSDHLLNATSLGPLIVVALIFFGPAVLVSLIGFYLSPSRVRRLARLRLQLDRLPFWLFALGLVLAAIYYGLLSYGLTAIGLAIAAKVSALLGALTLLARISFRRLYLAPTWFFSSICFFGICCFAVILGSIEGELARLGHVSGKVCALDEALNTQGCYPIIIYGSELSLLSNGANSVYLRKTNELEIRVNLVPRAH